MSVRLKVAVASGSSSTTVPVNAAPVLILSVDRSRKVNSSFFESSSCTGVTVNWKVSLAANTLSSSRAAAVLYSGGNGGGVPEADALGLDGDFAERVDGLLAGSRLAVRAVAGGARGQAPCPDGHLQQRVLGIGGHRGALIHGADARRETDARRLRRRRPGRRRQQYNRQPG